MMFMIKDIHQNVHELQDSIAKLQNKMQDKKECVSDFSGNITNSFGSCGKNDNMEREESAIDSDQAEVKYSLKYDEQTLAKYEKNVNDKTNTEKRRLSFPLSADSSRYLFKKEKRRISFTLSDDRSRNLIEKIFESHVLVDDKNSFNQFCALSLTPNSIMECEEFTAIGSNYLDPFCLQKKSM